MKANIMAQRILRVLLVLAIMGNLQPLQSQFVLASSVGSDQTKVAEVPNNSANEGKSNLPSLNSLISINNTSRLTPERAQQTLLEAGATIHVDIGGERPSIAADGHYMAFESSSTDLVSGDTNGTSDIFVHDLQIGSNALVSVASNGTQGNGSSHSPSISANGRYVAFYSCGSSNLVEYPTGMCSVFVHNLQTRATALVSSAINNTQEDGASINPSISGDGRYVAFESYSSNLVNDDTNERLDIFVRDIETQTTRRVSWTPEGAQRISDSKNPSISANGRYVAYNINSSGWGGGTTYIYDMKRGTTITMGGSYEGHPSLSADGRYVVFASAIVDLFSSGSVNIFVYDQQTGNTNCISCIGSNSSNSPFISADGRYVTFSSYDQLIQEDINYKQDVYIYDRSAGTTNLVSVAMDGTQGNSSSSGISPISADGKIVAFHSNANNLVSEGTGGLLIRGNVIQPPKEPVILVHGFQGFASFDGDSETDGYQCSTGIERYAVEEDGKNNSTLTPAPGLVGYTHLADWLEEDGYEVWIAHLNTNSDATDSLVYNAKCLRKQIEYVESVNHLPITVIAHSMGGLVSRAAINYLNPKINIKSLFTLGSPHSGLPTDVFKKSLVTNFSICKFQVGICDMAIEFMKDQFNPNHRNIKGVKYYFFGGDGGNDILLTPLLAYYKEAQQGPNDGLVGQYSAVGWLYPHSLQPDWMSESAPGQFFTSETHPSLSSASLAYYVAPPKVFTDEPRSESYYCIRDLMQNPPYTQSQFCNYADGQTPPEINHEAKSYTETKAGHLEATLATAQNLAIDGAGAALFYLTWNGGAAPSFTLTSPDAVEITPQYAADHPTLVTYEIASGTPQSAPHQAYSFAAGQTGIWQLSIEASSDPIDFQVFGVVDANRTLVAQTDKELYTNGDTALITAILDSSGIPLSGATVNAKITSPAGVESLIPLTDNLDGTYTGTYLIPDAPGHLTIDITASGNDGGVLYTRNTILLQTIAPNDVLLTGVYSEAPIDEDNNLLYEKLNFTLEAELATVGDYAIAADLYVGDQFVTHVGDFYSLISGTQAITLPFDGEAIRRTGLNGPYKITNLYITPIDIGITAQSATDVFTTSTYSHTQFGLYPCHLLTLGHSGSGGDPVASPANSASCNANEYIAGESIGLIASPATDWAISNWSGTDNDTSVATSNTFLMPAETHSVTVNYTDIAAPFTTCATQTEISATECNALVALYNSTNGVDWTNHTDWLQTDTPCSWYGVTCSAGHIIRLSLGGQWDGNEMVSNRLVGAIPVEITNLENLVWLDLSQNQLNGSIPIEIGSMANLTNLYLSGNQLNGSIPTQLGGLSNLWQLDLSSNQLSGSIPPQLGSLTNLRWLVLSDNQLSGFIPAQLGSLLNLQVLSLATNQLNGSIPAQLGSLLNLEVLSLETNQLSGSIPAQLGSLLNLQSLYLSNNHLSGSIPAELGSLSNLQDMNLHRNQLNGSIPLGLSNLSSLKYLLLSENQLSGSIPIELGNLSQLYYLDLSSNRLTGSIPAELGNLTYLLELYLDTNHLDGEFPASITNLVNLYNLTVDCRITSSNASVAAYINTLIPGWQNRSCPTLILPQANAVLDNGRIDRLDNIVWDFDWSNVQNAAKYHLYVYHTGAVYPVIDNPDITDSSYHDVSIGSYISDIDGWKWKVKAYINGQWGEWSEIRTFSVEPANTDLPVSFSNTFTGGIGSDDGYKIVLDSSGNIFIAGTSDAAWGSPIQIHNGGKDVFVAKLDPSGNLLWNTFIGGVGDDWGSSISLDANGDIYIGGSSDSAWGISVRAYAGGSDAFAAKLDASGNLLWNTFLGGTGHDDGFITLDANRNVFIAGSSSAAWGNPVDAYSGYSDAFVAKLDPSGSLLWNTFLGSAKSDGAQGIAVDNNSIYLTGYSDLTWGNPLRSFSGGFSDAFVIKLNESGNLLWNTFLGGTEHDEAGGIAIGSNGNIYVSGYSDAAGWGDPIRPYSSSRDAFAAGLNPSGALLWNTFLGGAGGDGSNSIIISTRGNIFVSGSSSANWGNPMNVFTGGSDAFVAKLDELGVLTGNTFVGGSGMDSGNDIVVDTSEKSYVVGWSSAAWGNPVNAFAGGIHDAFIAKINLSVSFVDVPYSYWAWPYIKRLSNAGVTGGCGTGVYCPDNTVTRAQMAVFLLKSMHGSSYTPPAVGASTGFTDVPADHWATAWIKQLAAEGITSGCGNGNYCPEATVTRAQMAIFLLKAKHSSSYSPPNAAGVFSDVPVGYWADKWIEQLASEGVTSGCGNGNYCPDASVTRAQMAVFLVKAFGLP